MSTPEDKIPMPIAALHASDVDEEQAGLIVAEVRKRCKGVPFDVTYVKIPNDGYESLLIPTPAFGMVICTPTFPSAGAYRLMWTFVAVASREEPLYPMCMVVIGAGDDFPRTRDKKRLEVRIVTLEDGRGYIAGNWALFHSDPVDLDALAECVMNYYVAWVDVMKKVKQRKGE